jgi:hypothetical protein
MMPLLLRRWILPAAIALSAAACSGQDGVSLVKGKVLYNDQPLAGAELEFKPEKDLTLGSFGGATDADGRFEVKIGKGTGMNARPGRFVVLITKGKSMAAMPPEAATNEEERVIALMQIGPGGPGEAGRGMGVLPAKYASAASTPFRVEISDGANDLNPFRLNGPALKKR